jgi:hypothetical protein
MPYEVAGGHKPSIAHQSRIGVQAYYLNNKLECGDEMESRALIVHLVGYDSTNIFRIWLPGSKHCYVHPRRRVSFEYEIRRQHSLRRLEESITVFVKHIRARRSDNSD